MEARAKMIGLRSLPRRQIIITFAGVMLAMFLSSLDQTVVSTAMPRIVSDLGGFSHYTWVTTAYVITMAVTIPITGKLTDMYGRKWFYVTGLVIFVGASLLSGLSQTMMQLIIFRGVQGIGAGIMMANALTAIGDLFPPAERGKYMGFMSGIFGLSSIIGPILGGFITDTLSWNWVFFVNIPIGISIIILFIFFFPNFRPDNSTHKVDYAGVVALIFSVVPFMLAISWGGIEYPWRSFQIIGMLIFSAIMSTLFVFIEQRSKEPIMPLGLFRNRIVTFSEVVIFLTAFGMFGGIIFIPLFFQGVLGTTATTSGSFLMPMMLGVVFGSFLSGQALSRTGGHYRIQGAIGIGIMALSMFLLSIMTVETNYTTIVFNIVLLGFGLGITMPLYTIAVQNAVPYNFLGVATSSTAFFRSLGGSVSLAIFGSVMNNRFSSELVSSLPPVVKKAIPPETLASLAHNPQALVNPQAQAQLRIIFNQLGSQGADLFKEMLRTLRSALSSAISEVFLIGLYVLIIGFIINLFIKEIPLRKHHMPTSSLSFDHKPVL
ncbi:MDR family MFS transporter [Chloroflexota bacterium]